MGVETIGWPLGMEGLTTWIDLGLPSGHTSGEGSKHVWEPVNRRGRGIRSKGREWAWTDQEYTGYCGMVHPQILWLKLIAIVMSGLSATSTRWLHEFNFFHNAQAVPTFAVLNTFAWVTPWGVCLDNAWILMPRPLEVAGAGSGQRGPQTPIQPWPAEREDAEPPRRMSISALVGKQWDALRSSHREVVSDSRDCLWPLEQRQTQHTGAVGKIHFLLPLPIWAPQFQSFCFICHCEFQCQYLSIRYKFYHEMTAIVGVLKVGINYVILSKRRKKESKNKTKQTINNSHNALCFTSVWKERGHLRLA